MLDSTGSLLQELGRVLEGITPSDSSPALPPQDQRRDIFQVSRRSGWDSGPEPRCDFERRPRLTRHAGVWILSLWQSSLMGQTLSEIKSDPEQIPHFAAAVSDFLLGFLGGSLPAGDWCLVTSPRRRPLERNFAHLVGEDIASRLGITFYPDAARCSSRQRVNAVFELGNNPIQPNVIVFDDIVTTGCTLASMSNLLRPLGKNTLFVAGINNNR